MLKQASSEIRRDKITRVEKVRNAAENVCIDGCNGSWLECAIEALSMNDIELTVFASYIFEILAIRSGEMIYGQTNCAKTFILKPLKCIFDDRLFDNPANDKYAWVGADKQGRNFGITAGGV